MEPLKRSAAEPLYLPRPIASGPFAANGVVSVALPAAAPLTYRLIAPVEELYSPTRWVQVPVVGAVAAWARIGVGLAASVATREKAQALSAASYWRKNPEAWLPSWVTASDQLPVADRFAHAETVKELAVLSTGPLVAICCPVAAAKDAPLPVQVAPVAFAVLPVPEESVTVEPVVCISVHQPVGWPVPSW